MIMNLRKTVYDMLIRHEGWKNRIYSDTRGISTIGVGFNLVSPGLYDEEIEFILNRRITMVIKELTNKFDWFQHLDPPRYAAMIDLYYNMGPKLFEFKNFLANMQQSKYYHAADDLLDSNYAKQTGKRAEEIAAIIRTGELQTQEG